MSVTSKKTIETLGQRLPYFNFDPITEAIWLKDGSATLSLKLTPKDCANFTDEDLESLRFGLTPVLGHLPEGSVLQAILIREQSTSETDLAFARWRASHCGDQGTKERNALAHARQSAIEKDFENKLIFQTRIYLTLRMLPQEHVKAGKVMGPFSHLAFLFTPKSKISEKTRTQVLHDLSSALDGLRTGLEAIGFEVDLVAKEERLRMIYSWLNPERSESIPPPKESKGAPLSELVALTDMIETEKGVSLGRTHLAFASLKSLPEISFPAAMGVLGQATHPFSMIFTVFVLNQTEEREKLIRRQRLAQGMASGNTVRNLMAEAQLRDIEDTLNALISSGEKLLAVSFHLSGQEIKGKT